MISNYFFSHLFIVVSSQNDRWSLRRLTELGGMEYFIRGHERGDQKGTQNTTAIRARMMESSVVDVTHAAVESFVVLMSLFFMRTVSII